MGISFSSDFDPDHIMKGLYADAAKAGEEGIAEQFADAARGRGLDSVDELELDLEVEGDPKGQIAIDEARVRVRANEILRGE